MHSPPITRGARAVGLVLAMIVIGALGLSSAGAAATSSAGSGDRSGDRPTVVFVHGSFADTSGFNDVIQRLQARGYPTIAPSNPLRGLASDAAYVRSVLDSIDGPIVLVAHSYGGMVITNAATGDPDVKALVYINAFAPAEGETAADLVYRFPGSMIILENLTLRPFPTTDPTRPGLDAYINADVFREAFAADVDRRTTASHAGEITVAQTAGRTLRPHAARVKSRSTLGRLKEDERMDLPKVGEVVSFAAHIKVLFRERDRQAMTFAFDLWSYEDVRDHAQPIVERLQAGTMPCDGAWTVEKIDAFERWIDGGMTA